MAKIKWVLLILLLLFALPITLSTAPPIYLCNNNNICEQGETITNCPTDCLVQGWPMVGRTPDHQSYYPKTINVKNFGLKWAYNAGNKINGISATNNKVYLGAQNGLHVINPDNGSLISKWAHPLGYGISVSPAISEGKVSTGTYYGLYAIDEITVQQEWSALPGRMISGSPTIANNRIYVGAGSEIKAIDAQTGSEIWSYTTSGSNIGSPAVSNNRVYVVLLAYHLNLGWWYTVYALDASTGSLVWGQRIAQQLQTSGPVQMFIKSPAVFNNRVYLTIKGWTYALDANSGSLIWRGLGNTNPTFGDGTVYVGGLYGGVYALNANSGGRIWVSIQDVNITSTSVSDNVVFAASKDTIYGLNVSDGAKVWNYTIRGDEITTSPIIADDKVYIGTRYGKVYAFSSIITTQDVVESTEKWINGEIKVREVISVVEKWVP